jgi:hypothetical protein
LLTQAWMVVGTTQSVTDLDRMQSMLDYMDDLLDG